MTAKSFPSHALNCVQVFIKFDMIILMKFVGIKSLHQRMYVCNVVFYHSEMARRG